MELLSILLEMTAAAGWAGVGAGLAAIGAGIANERRSPRGIIILHIRIADRLRSTGTIQ